VVRCELSDTPQYWVQSARDLGVYVNGGMTMRAHINHVLPSCYVH